MSPITITLWDLPITLMGPMTAGVDELDPGVSRCIVICNAISSIQTIFQIANLITARLLLPEAAQLVPTT